MSRRLGTAVGATALALVGLVAAGCQAIQPADAGGNAGNGSAAKAGAKSGAKGSDAAGKPGIRSVAVEITDSGCHPTPAKLPAGATTFTVTNAGASGITEAELINAQGRIVGERENLTPGLSGSFSLRLEAGTYSLYCPGATTENVTLTVTGKATRHTVPTAIGTSLEQGTSGYADYVRSQTAQLVTATGTFTDAVRAGDLAKAKRLYGPARVFYERIEPVAESFGALDPAIDARINDVSSPKSWTGFHPLEQALFQKGSTAGLKPLADKLDRDVRLLATRAKSTSYQPADLANGATGLLDEVAASKITGEEEHYSHLDLLDIWANVDGAKRAYDLLSPALRRIDGSLASTIDARFAAVNRTLAGYRDGSSFVPYTKLTKAQVKQLSDQVDALAEPLSTIAEKVAAYS